MQSRSLPPLPARPVLSVLVPVYNERNTVQPALDALVAKRIDGWDIEIIIIESNSTDGSREIVLNYQSRPGVKVVLEDKPRGKGHAVRAGLAHATGDVVLIQDADLEYDLADYEKLLDPLIAAEPVVDPRIQGPDHPGLRIELGPLVFHGDDRRLSRSHAP